MENVLNVPRVIRNYKDTLFRMIFSDKKNLLSLYNAMNETTYEEPEDLEIITLENAIYMSMKNDLAFIMDFRMYLYEHQSTDNPNIPVRMLFYETAELEKLLQKKTLYSSFRQKIPTPKFFVFYNGIDERPERWEQRLSDAYTISVEYPDLELIVHVININEGKNTELKEHCKMLKDYSIYVAKVREYAAEYPLPEAVEHAIEYCINNNILEDFLRKNRAEVVKVSIFEYDEEREMKLIREDEREIGIEIGRCDGLREGKANGENKLAGLIQCLLRDNLQSLIEVVINDMEKRNEMYQKYNLL